MFSACWSTRVNIPNDIMIQQSSLLSTMKASFKLNFSGGRVSNLQVARKLLMGTFVPTRAELVTHATEGVHCKSERVGAIL